MEKGWGGVEEWGWGWRRGGAGLRGTTTAEAVECSADNTQPYCKLAEVVMLYGSAGGLTKAAAAGRIFHRCMMGKNEVGASQLAEACRIHSSLVPT